MGNSVANQASHPLKKDQMLLHLNYDKSQSSLTELWESICNEIQNNLASEEDNTLFRLLLPNFDLFTANDTSSVIRFLKCLKSLVRSTNCVCLISVEEQLLSPIITNHLVALADSVYSITSFKDHAEMKIGEYDGTFKLLK